MRASYRAVRRQACHRDRVASVHGSVQEGAAMPQFMMIYKGDATDMADMTPEQGMEVMAKWEAWMQRIGPALVDVGSPFGPGASVVDDGSAGTAAGLTGYSIVEAADSAAAQGLADGHPYLSDNSGDYAIDIFELMPVPFDDD